MRETTQSPVHAHTIGNLAEGRSMIGQKSQPISGPFPVDEVRIAQFRAMIQTPTPPSSARSAAAVAPPSSLQLWVRQLPWTDGEKPPRSMLATVPLPGTSLINVSTDIEYHQPIRVGDTLTEQDELASISDLKSTALGNGHFVTTIARFHNQDGELIATCTNVLFRFDPKKAAT